MPHYVVNLQHNICFKTDVLKDEALTRQLCAHLAGERVWSAFTVVIYMKTTKNAAMDGIA